VPNSFGLASSPYNYIYPGKRPLSSAVPTIVEEDGMIVACLGASGGSQIITGTLQTLLGILDWGLDPLQAVNRLRLHHQLVPNEVLQLTLGSSREVHNCDSRGYDIKTQNLLTDIGHKVT
jgi:gamma-glutamyltranspeptidase